MQSAAGGLLPLTFHSELGATAVLVDEDEQDDEDKANKPGQSHSDGHLRQRRSHQHTPVGAGNTI